MTLPRCYSVREVADHLGCAVEIVLGHIRAGRLAAVNVGLGTIKPRWAISPDALEEFKGLRASGGSEARAKPSTNKRRKLPVVTRYSDAW